MKVLKLSNKLFAVFFLTFILNINNLYSEEEVQDIWNIDSQEKKKAEVTDLSETYESSIYEMQTNKKNDFEIIKEENTKTKEIKLAGIYDPQENSLSLEMWSNSNGNQIKSVLKKIDEIDLSDDSREILNIVLLTNSYIPKKNITTKEFLEFKNNHLIKIGDLNLVKLYLIKNQDLKENDKLIKFFVDENLSNSQLQEACSIFDDIKNVSDDYLSKFKIYCLFNFEKRNEAQLLFDLKKELGLNDKFFENKFNYLMGYETKNIKEISEDNLLNFHLSHRTDKNFLYEPNKSTKKIIWKYLSSNNLLQKTETIDLENIDKIKLIEKATHEKNYDEKELFDLYKRFQFSIDQLINAEESYGLLPNHKGRALLYQKLLLSKNIDDQLNLLIKIKESFIQDKIENAFNSELTKALNRFNSDEISSNHSSFYNKYYQSNKNNDLNIKFNNKIIHQSKLLNYFIKEESIDKIQKETNDLLKKIKKNKKYYFTTKDFILLESLISDGIEISEKNKELYEKNEPDIPYDIQIMINNNEKALALLRLVQIIGEDELNNLGTETLYFMISTLNQINIDSIRDKIILKTLPLKV